MSATFAFTLTHAAGQASIFSDGSLDEQMSIGTDFKDIIKSAIQGSGSICSALRAGESRRKLACEAAESLCTATKASLSESQKSVPTSPQQRAKMLAGSKTMLAQKNSVDGGVNK